MKNYKYRAYNLLVIFWIGIVSLISCSHDNSLSVREYGKVYMPQARDNPAQHELKYTDSLQTLYFSAKLGGPGTINNSIPVSFKVDSTLVDTFNYENNTAYPVMPFGSYSMGDEEQSIPAGKEDSDVSSIVINTKNLQQGMKYLLPVQMTVKGGGINVNKKLQTTYYLISIPAEGSPGGDGGGNNQLPLIDKKNWTIHDFSSQDPDHGQFAKNVIDGDGSTLWQGNFGDNKQPLPHSVSINMGQSHQIHGLKINPKHSNAKSLPTQIKVEFSDDGNSWDNSTTFSNPFTYSENDFKIPRLELPEPMEAQYFRVIILKDAGNVPVTGLNEVDAF